MSRRRRLMAALAALGVFVLQPAAAGRAALNADANVTCPVSNGMPTVTGQVLEFTGTLSCYRPGGHQQFGDQVNPGNKTVRDPNPTLGEPCRDVFNYPVAFTEADSGAAMGIFNFAGGATSGNRPLSPDDAALIGTHDFYVTDVQLGTYEPSVAAVPTSPLTCQINPTYFFYCPATRTDDQFCFTPVDHPIGPASSRPQDFGPFFKAAIGTIGGGAGTIHSAPSQIGVVNSPVCFWIDGMGIPAERDLTLTLAGAPDGSGRQVFYTFLARVRFGGVRWDFNELDGNTTTELPPATSACQQHPAESTTAHRYQQISDDRNPDHMYHVTATELYSITVDMFWIDFGGAHGAVPVTSVALNNPTLTPATYAQYVGQVEGVPIGSP